MKILILSDTHGDISAAQRAIEKERPQHVIHLGDCLRDAEELEKAFPMLPICKVPGNNDWFTDEQKEKVITLCGTKIFLCHGHTTGVKGGYDVQSAKAIRQQCTVSLFGHTHREMLKQTDELLLLNPGSITYGGTYAILVLSPGEPPKAEIKTDC